MWPAAPARPHGHNAPARRAAALLPTLLLVGGVAGKQITGATWELDTYGKGLFVNFHSPELEHCKSVMLDWDKLAQHYKGSPTVGVFDVDCTTKKVGGHEGKYLCEMHGVKEYPTIMYGPAGELRVYTGSTRFTDLLRFAGGNLRADCSLENVDLCDEAERSIIERFMNMSTRSLGKLLAETNKKFDAKRHEIDFKRHRYDMKHKSAMGEKAHHEKVKANLIKAGSKEDDKEHAKAQRHIEKHEGLANKFEMQKAMLDQEWTEMQVEKKQVGLKHMRVVHRKKQRERTLPQRQNYPIHYDL